MQSYSQIIKSNCQITMDYYAKLHGTLHDQGFPPEWRGKAGILPIPQNFKPPSVGCSHLFCPSTKKFRLFASCPPLSFLWSWTKYQTRYFWMTQLKLSFTNILCLFVWIFLIVNLSLNQTLLTFLLYVRQTYMAQLILVISLWQVIFNPKGFYYSYV